MSRYDSDRYCYYLERICRLRHLNGKIKDVIVSSFLGVKTLDDLNIYATMYRHI